MNNRYSSKAGGVMIEYVILIMFLIVISVFLLKITATTEKTRDSADKLSKATILAESIMDTVYASSDKDTALDALKFTKLTANEEKLYTRYYDNQWSPSDVPDTFVVTVTITDEPHERGTLTSYTINVSEVKPMELNYDIYTLNGSKYWSDVKEGN